MGAIVQTKQVATTSQASNPTGKQQLTLSDFQVLKIVQGGHSIVRYDQTKKGLFVSKRIPQPVFHIQKDNLLNWVKANTKNSCSVIGYTIKDESFFCSSYVNFKAIVEYTDCSLSSLLKSTHTNCQLEQFQLLRRQICWSNPVEILNLIKFCIQTAEEHHQNTKKWPVFHTTNVLYFKQLKQLKFLYIPLMDQCHQNQIFFDPQSQQFLNKESEKTTVFSIGMIIMSFLIKEDCSECYDYQRFQFCQSVFEEKIQKLQSLSSKNPLLCQLSRSQIGVTLQEQLIQFALCATSHISKRPNLSQLKRKYFKLLRQISLGCQSASYYSTNRVQGRERSFLKSRRARQEVKPFQAREPPMLKQRSSDTDDTFELPPELRRQKEKVSKKCYFKNEFQDFNKQNVRMQQHH